ncbi:hypothetical protein LQG66_02425 [Bradyrhizobium ontarionense]|uniref:Uncharacterized protein n=1 Tax=Bradyrhizobium ontarionense TaxID=2898149 RepID=A0ABY3RCR6_9BRAD|nr:hypothetical protein [Bradyrhizobium sp. A19]UFZ05199.1 hypothetical protein LQG66_02425 [Bradyrhizobium sp. A19]
MPSATYQLIIQAMIARRQILCMYRGFARALCPIILGHTVGRERVLAFQFAGGASRGLPPGGQWKCFDVADMSEVELREGRWHSGSSHRQPQHCVAEVEVDVNPDSPYGPKRSIATPRSRKPGRKR